MAASFLDPAFAASNMISKQKERTTIIAKEQQRAIEARLKKNHLEMPPFEFLELIGKGAYGRVFKANDLKRKEVVALKVVDVDPHDYKVHVQEKDDSIDTVLHEIKVLRQLRDSNARNINLYIDAFPIHSQLWIVTEYCPGGSLHTLMQGTGSKLEEKYIIPVARELAIALKAIHAAGIIHRDLKAANVMIHERGMLQVIDFGVAGLLQTSKEKRSTVIGTPHWMAPEMSSQIAQRGPPSLDYGTEVDVWAYGCTLYEIAMGHPPYHRAAAGRALTMMHKRKIPELQEDGFSQALTELVSYVLQSDPGNRPSMNAVAQHHYVLNTENTYPTQSLADLVKIYYRWEYSGGQRSSLFMPGGAEAAAFPNDNDEDLDWNFSTTANFDQQFSRSITVSDQPTITMDLNPAVERSTPQHPDAVADDHAALHQPYPELYTPTSSSDLVDFMGSSPEADTPTEKSIPKRDGGGRSLDETPPNNAPSTNEGSAKRGEQSLGAIFDKSAAPYQYGSTPESQDQHRTAATRKSEGNKPSAHRSHSDLPLRNDTSESSVHRMEVDSDNSEIIKKIPNIDLANVGTIKANRMNRSHGSTSDSDTKGEDRSQKNSSDKRATMDWKFPAPEKSVETAIPGHRGTMDWSFASASMITDDSQDEPLPIRPGLRHMATAPVGDISRARGSFIDLDALYESESHDDTSAGFPTAPPSDEDDDQFHYQLSDESPPTTTIPSSNEIQKDPHPDSLRCQQHEEQEEWIGYLLEAGMDPPLARMLVRNDPTNPSDDTPQSVDTAKLIINQWLDSEHITSEADRSGLLQDALQQRKQLLHDYREVIRQWEQSEDVGSDEKHIETEMKEERAVGDPSRQFQPVQMPNSRLFEPQCPPDVMHSECSRLYHGWLDSLGELRDALNKYCLEMEREAAVDRNGVNNEDNNWFSNQSLAVPDDFEGIMKHLNAMIDHYADHDTGIEGGDEA